MCSWYYSFQIPIGHQLWKLDVDDTDLLINKLIPKHKENLCFFGLDLITDEASGGKYLVFLSSRSVQMRDSSAFSVCTFFEESVFILQFLEDEIHSYVVSDIIVHFIIQKLKNKPTFLKKYTNCESWGISHFDRTRGEKNQIFPTLVFPHFLSSVCHSGLDLDLE